MIYQNINGEKRLIASSITKHAQLQGRNVPNAHEISAITGLAQRLDEIQVLADKCGGLENLLKQLENSLTYKLSMSYAATPEKYSIVYKLLDSSIEGTLDISVNVLPNAIVQRDTNGNIKVPAPNDDLHAANKNYVDTQVFAKLSKQDYTGGTAVYAVSGSTQKLMKVSTAVDTDTIAYRTTGGTLNVGTPTASTHATTKDYVDKKHNSALEEIQIASDGVLETLDEDVSGLYELLKGQGYGGTV